MITYKDNLIGVEVGQLSGFFVGWPKAPNKLIFYKILDQSYKIVIARDGDKVVGFINAISDGILSASIPLLEVLPEYQGKGIGQELVKRMNEKLSHLYMIDVPCDKEVQPFYTKLGLKEAHGVCHRNYDKQSGS